MRYYAHTNDSPDHKGQAAARDLDPELPCVVLTKRCELKANDKSSICASAAPLMEWFTKVSKSLTRKRKGCGREL